MGCDTILLLGNYCEWIGVEEILLYFSLGFDHRIMGPTGAGKSSFIESLGLKDSSKISSNGLNGYTQTIATYKINNVTQDGRTIYLVDSPGFADTKISELSIVSMLQKWIKDNDRVFSRLLFLTPITHVRLPGSQRHVLKTFQAITGIETAKNIKIVTTMWDCIWGEQAVERAERTYDQFQNDIWKSFIEEGSQIARFLNTEESALSILDIAFGHGAGRTLSIERNYETIHENPYAPNLFTDLQDRIQNLKSDIANHHVDLAYAEEIRDEELKSVIFPRLLEAQEDLARFQKEFDDSGLNGLVASPLPQPEVAHTTGYFESTQPVVASDPSSDPVSESAPPQDVVLTSIPSSCPGADAQQGNTPAHDHPYLTTSPLALQEFPDAPIQQPQSVTPRSPGRLSRVFKSMKCWGDAVGEHQDS
ncbi:hypothetical protein BJ165DRAFT_1513122 [Panaeolus papilionaceus]|nr:hypothetical protein BJ165DRAFT_1513122 [Panaeolus papilionaceus]